MPTVFQALYRKTTQFNQKLSYFASRLIFHRFSLFNCCFSVALWRDKRDYPENVHVVFLS